MVERLTNWLFPTIPTLEGYRGKRVLFTGCATGLGKEAVVRLAAEGARLFLVDFNGEALEATAQECRKLFPGTSEQAVSTMAVDLSEPNRSLRIVRAAIRFLGGLDFLFLNHNGSKAGSRPIAGASFLPSMPLTDETLQAMIAVNITSSIALVRDAMPFLLESNGSVSFTASTGATLRLPFLSMYSTLKQGMVAFLESLRQELKLIDGKNVTITITYLNAVGTETFHRQVGKDQPIRIDAPPEQVSSPADAAVFLLQNAVTRKEDAYGPLPGLWFVKIAVQLFPRWADSLTRKIPTATDAAKSAVLQDYAKIKTMIMGSGYF